MGLETRNGFGISLRGREVATRGDGIPWHASLPGVRRVPRDQPPEAAECMRAMRVHPCTGAGGMESPAR